MDKEINLNIVFTAKAYLGVGFTVSIGFDFDYFCSHYFQGND